MAQARKVRHAGRKPARGVPGWLWLFTGLAAGLLVALYVYLDQRPSKPAAHDQAPTPAAAAPKPKTEATKPAHPAAKSAPEEKPRFEFYTILPEMEVVVPDSDRESAKDPNRLAPGESYVLQVASFRALEEADRMKANLALLGIESRIETVTANNETWHRVRLGPYRDMPAVDDARARLQENQINAVLLKVTK